MTPPREREKVRRPHLPWQTITWEYGRQKCWRRRGMWGSSAPGLEDTFTWPPYSFSDLGALCWVCTSRRPLGSLCSSSGQSCCTPAASRWSLWTAPGGTRWRNVIGNILSYHTCAGSTGLQEFVLQFYSSVFFAAGFQTLGVSSQFHAWSPRLAHLQVDDGVCAVALHGVELQVPLEVLGVETRDGQTVAEASLRRDGGDQGFKKALFPVKLHAAALLSSLHYVL